MCNFLTLEKSDISIFTGSYIFKYLFSIFQRLSFFDYTFRIRFKFLLDSVNYYILFPI